MDIPDHLRSTARAMRNACVAETNVDEKYIDMSKNGYISDDPKLKCYVHCLLEHAGMMDESGKIDAENVLHLFPPEHRNTIEYVTKVCKTRCKSKFE